MDKYNIKDAHNIYKDLDLRDTDFVAHRIIKDYSKNSRIWLVHNSRSLRGRPDFPINELNKVNSSLHIEIDNRTGRYRLHLDIFERKPKMRRIAIDNLFYQSLIDRELKEDTKGLYLKGEHSINYQFHKLSKLYTYLDQKFEKDLYSEKHLSEMTPMSNNKSVPTTLSTPPLNQILYGPPGTGKTYNTICMAVDIIDGKNPTRTYEQAKDRFDELRTEGRIVFVTFHQNYSYEDFVKGLRPRTQGETLSFIDYKGPFYTLVQSAESGSKKKDFETVFNELLGEVIEKTVDYFEVQMVNVSYKITDINDNSIGFEKSSGGTAHRLSIRTLKKRYEDEDTSKDKSGLEIYYAPLTELLLERGKTQIANSSKTNNYVLIIDEINRANISRVFGELITLIEEDKRAGNKHAMTVTLPSGESFTVPNNLYIIGTMNTADKSIALLDIALRRRFTFVPMYPQYDIPGVTIYRKEFLRALNKAISDDRELGRDLQIGHSYFMDDGNGGFDFYDVLRTKVVPLLLEYTMNDEGKVEELLKNALKAEGYKTDKDVIESLMPWSTSNPALLIESNISDELATEDE